MSWSVLRKKRYDILNLEPDERLALDEWQKYVESDSTLIWAEDSPVSKAFLKEGHDWVNRNRYRMNAYFEINKKGVGNLRFKFFENHLSVDCERQTLNRVEKMWQVAEALNGYLFKNGTRFTEKKLEKLREKYDKTGKKAPNDNHEA